jgi:hypothetical protein
MLQAVVDVYNVNHMYYTYNMQYIPVYIGVFTVEHHLLWYLFESDVFLCGLVFLFIDEYLSCPRFSLQIYGF